MLQRHRTDSGLIYLVSPLLQQAHVLHAFSTRLGGVSLAPFESLNLGMLSDPGPQDDPASLFENYRRLRQAIGCEERERCWVHQVHGNRVCEVRPGEAFENGPKADALVSDDPARLISVKYADCVPILLATTDGRAVAAVHSGWRGVIAGVVTATVKRLTELAGDRAESLIAAIGPCIGFERFEVGGEVVAAFAEAFGERAPIRRAGEKGLIDLQASVRMQLIAAGLKINAIDGNDLCTYRDRDLFFSHRRDVGITGRMAALIGPRGNGR